MKLVNNKFKSGGLHEKHVVATWNLVIVIAIVMSLYLHRSALRPAKHIIKKINVK